jgi:nitroimidazol reductase NimA-like FMN-containing flavoprotein (pyridoxamine 5'-phosphate oxidase superfamily)
MSDPLGLDRNGLEVLDRADCLDLLRSATIGRISITSGALPVILPVNFVVSDECILFRTSPGTKLDAATRNAVVAFEVDDFDRFGHSGWSVVVVGITREVDPPDHVRRAIPRWAPSDDGRVVSIDIESVSGRRLNQI